jgi:hypothetical protein
LVPFVFTAAAFCALGYGLGRLHHTSSRAPKDESPSVITFKGGRISAKELDAAIEAQGPLVKARYANVGAKKELALDLAHEKLMALRAQEAGLDADAEFARDYRRRLGGLYLKRELTEPEAKRPVASEELQAYFAQHVAEFHRPEQVQVAVILLKASAADTGKRRGEAEKLLHQLAEASAHDFYAFATTARARSEDMATRALGGRWPPQTPDELARRYGQSFAEAVAALSAPNQIAPQVLPGPEGLYLVQLVRRDAERNPSLEELAPTLTSRVKSERAEREKTAFLKKLEENAGLQWVQ